MEINKKILDDKKTVGTVGTVGAALIYKGFFLLLVGTSAGDSGDKT